MNGALSTHTQEDGSRDPVTDDPRRIRGWLTVLPLKNSLNLKFHVLASNISHIAFHTHFILSTAAAISTVLGIYLQFIYIKTEFFYKLMYSIVHALYLCE